MNISSLLNPSSGSAGTPKPTISHILQYAAEDRQRGEYVESLRFQSEASKQANEKTAEQDNAPPTPLRSTSTVHSSIFSSVYSAATAASTPQRDSESDVRFQTKLPSFDRLRLLTDRDSTAAAPSYPSYTSTPIERLTEALTPPREETRYGGMGVYASPNKDQSPYMPQPLERIANAFFPPSPADSLTAFASIATGFRREGGFDAIADNIRRMHERKNSNASRASSTDAPASHEHIEHQRNGGVSTPASMMSSDEHWQQSNGAHAHSPLRSTQIPLSPPDSTQDSAPQTPRCSYTRDCNTGSPLRKVVSHIFGRNKLCTRQIPKHVWVHYCRKHYQRSRYRNPKGFALLQCELVRRQVERLESWGGVIDWVVKVRKREEIRLSKEKENGGRGSIDEDDFADSAKNAMSTKWLLGLTGTGKSTANIMTVLDVIEREIRETGCGFPDLEILPNVLTSETNNTTPGRSESRVESHHGTYSGVGLGLDLTGTGAGLKRKASMREESPASRSGTPRPYAPMKKRRTEASPMPGIEQLQRAVESGWEAIRHTDPGAIRSVPTPRPVSSF